MYMFPFSHTYILNRIYAAEENHNRSLSPEIIVGNILPDMIVDVNLRKNSKRNFQREVHDIIRLPGLEGLNLKTDLEKGIAIHVMGDNYSRVGTYWRPEKSSGTGWLKKLEEKVDILGVSDIAGKEELFKRRVVQCGLDIKVLERTYDETTELVKKGLFFLEKNIDHYTAEAERITGVDRKTVKSNFERVIRSFGYETEFHADPVIRSYAAVRVINDMGNPRYSFSFYNEIANHQGCNTVSKILKVMDCWAEEMGKTAEAIRSSGIKFS